MRASVRGLKGLGRVVVRPRVQRLHHVLLGGAHRQHHHRHPGLLPDLARDLVAVLPRHGHVQHHQIRPLPCKGFQRRGSVRCLHGEVAGLAEREGDQAQQLEVVVGDEDLHAASLAGRGRTYGCGPSPCA
jgi:hypothetical protein